MFATAITCLIPIGVFMAAFIVAHGLGIALEIMKEKFTKENEK